MLGCKIVQPNILIPILPVWLRDDPWGCRPLSRPVERMGINHRRLHVPMPEQFLNRTDVIAIF